MYICAEASLTILKLISDLGGENVPFLIHSLLSHKQQRSSVSTHVRWLERQLAELEKQCTQDLKRQREAIKYGCQPVGSFLGRAFILQPIWNLDAAINELPNDGERLHCPLPPVPDMDYPHEGHDSIAVKILLHFANYIFHLFSTKGGRSPPVEMSGSLSRSQLAAIHYVKEFIQSRYNCWVVSLLLSLSLSLSLPLPLPLPLCLYCSIAPISILHFTFVWYFT